MKHRDCITFVLALTLFIGTGAAAASPLVAAPEQRILSLEVTEGRELAVGHKVDREIAIASAPDAEHPPVARHGIAAEWSLGPIDREPAELAVPSLDLRLVNHDDVDYLVSVRGHGDAGSRQTRLAGRRSETYLRAGAARELRVHLDAERLDLLSHSGMARVSFDACPLDDGPCVSGTTAPVYFHEEAGRMLVYDEALLCRRFGCGDLSRTVPVERGTLRVLGGQPLLGDVAVDEEPDRVSRVADAPASAETGETVEKAAVWMTVCVKADIQTTDSGLTANGITEDRWVGANSASSYVVIGRGFRVRVTWSSWARTFDTDPSTGCVTFASPLGTATPLTGATVRVYGFATDSAGNRVRIHNAGLNTGSWYPGATYSALWTGQVLVPNDVHTYVLDGRANDRWTTIAAAAYGLYRYHDGNSGATISIGFDEGDCSNSGSIHGNAENYIESHNAHLFRVGRCASSASDAREKMLVTHELGHALLRLYYGYDGDDQPRNQTYTPSSSITTASPPQGSSCWNVSSYGMNSLEWNSQTFKEAYADFYSAKVWNLKASRGTYTYRGVAYDLEKWDNVGNTNTAGGFAQNWCGYFTTTGSVATKGDYLRFLWDFYTVAGCSSQPTRLDMFKIYRMVRENDRDGTFNLTYWNYDNALEYAIENSVSGLSRCEQAGFGVYADHNGL